MGSNVLRILKCAGISVVLSAIFLLVLSAVSYTASISETTLTIMIYASVVISVFLGAFLAARASESRVLLYSIAVSAVYYALLLALTLVINKSVTFNSHFFTMSAGIFAAGILGAIMGNH